jgi:hypothetical protein
MKPALPTSLRDQRHAARRMADTILRAAARRRRQAPKKKPPAIEPGPRRIRLADLKTALARKLEITESRRHHAAGAREE